MVGNAVASAYLLGIKLKHECVRHFVLVTRSHFNCGLNQSVDKIIIVLSVSSVQLTKACTTNAR
jgi:hypothetical protein